MTNFAKLVGLALVLSLFLAGCGGSGGGSSVTNPPANPTLTSITVTGASSVAAGSTLQLTAKGTYSDSSSSTLSGVIWTSSDPAVATVGGTGVVTGVKGGSATISAKVGTVIGTMSVSVTTVGPTLNSITVSAPATSLAAGATLQLTAQGMYSDNSSQILTSQVTWQSSNTAIATVSSSGLLTALQSGPVTITASQGLVTGSIAITVTQATMSSIAVTPATFSIAAGQVKQLAVKGFFSDGTSQDVTAQATWSSSATGNAAVSGSGIVTGVGTGSATITATVGTLNATATANVTAALLTSITVTPASGSIPAGQTQQFTASGVFSDGSSTDMTNSVTWSSTSTNVASINQTGLAKALTTGSTTIQASSGSVTGSAALSVSSATLTSIDISPDDQSIPVGGQVQLYVTGTYSDSTTQNLTTGVSWTSSDTALAMVDPATGVVTGVANSNGNTVTISATFGSLTNTTTVTVTPAVVVSIAISPAAASIAAGTTQPFTVNATFSDGSTQELTEGLQWISSAPTVASMDASGVATGLAVGDATITAAYGSFTANAALTVTPATLSSIVVTPISATVGINGTAQFNATGVFSDNSTQDLTSLVTWNSSNASVGVVDSSGLSTGFKAGSTTITAYYEGVSGSATFNVASVTLVSITITPSNPIVPPRAKLQMTAMGNYSDGSMIPLTTGVTWWTNTGRYCSVSSTGLVRVKNKTSSTAVPVYARLNGVTGQTTIIITSMTLKSLAITPVNPTIAVGTKQQFQLIGTFSNGSTTVDLTKSAKWQTSNYQDAVINNSGAATGIAPGSVTITASYGALTPATTTLMVSTATIQSIAVTPASPSVTLGSMQQFTATGTFSDASTQDITTVATWTSSSPTVALVNSMGLATSVTSGHTNINATFKGVTGGTALTVN